MLVFVCVCVYVCLRDNSAISHYDFVQYGPIATQLFIEIVGYDTCSVNKYHGNRSKFKGQRRRNCENTLSSITLEWNTIKMSIRC